ncbi:hypothetical protein CHUAL_010605 [Chamberlinius hualienensis]
MKMSRHRWSLIILVISGGLFLRITGLYMYFFQENYFSVTSFGFSATIAYSVNQLLHHKSPLVAPLYNYNYGYRLTGENSCYCHAGHNVELLILVKSACKNEANRMAIRQTWGNASRFANKTKLVFVLALPVDGSAQKRVEEEAAIYSDVIQGNFEDRYYNNTWKTIMAFDWVKRYCACAKFIFFVDDDFYVSVGNVLNLLKNISLRNAEVEFSHLYTGHLFFILPVRFYFNKFHVSLEEYPYNVFPPFINAGAFIVTRHTLMAFHYASMYVKPFKLDDAFVGILAKIVNVTATHNRYFYPYRVPSSRIFYRHLIASHGFRNPQQLIDEWNRQFHFGNV